MITLPLSSALNHHSLLVVVLLCEPDLEFYRGSTKNRPCSCTGVGYDRDYRGVTNQYTSCKVSKQKV